MHTGPPAHTHVHASLVGYRGHKLKIWGAGVELRGRQPRYLDQTQQLTGYTAFPGSPVVGTDKQPQEISVLEESHTSQEQKDQWALSQRKMGREYKTPEDIKTNFPRSDETRHWNINLIELFIKHKWTFIRGRAEFVNRNGHSPPRQIASSFCGDNCLEESRGRDGKRKAECMARLPQCSEVWSWLTRDWKWENAYMG